MRVTSRYSLAAALAVGLWVVAVGCEKPRSQATADSTESALLAEKTAEANTDSGEEKTAVVFEPMRIPSLETINKRIGQLNTDRVRVRTAPNTADSEIVGTLQTDEIVSVYQEEGSKTIKSEVWDYWYRISEPDSPAEWVNALFVDLYPLDVGDEPVRLDFYPNPADGTPGELDELVTEMHGSYQVVDRSRSKHSYKSGTPPAYWYQLKRKSETLFAEGRWFHGSQWQPLTGERARITNALYKPIEAIFPFTFEAFQTVFGSPRQVKEKVKKESAYYPGEFEYLKEYWFEAAVVTVYETSHDRQRAWITGIQISSEATAIAYGIKIGEKKETLVSILGEPNAKKGSQYLYQIENQSAKYELNFDIKDDRISRIEWTFASYI